MNQIQIFENSEFGKIRVVEKDGQPWFVGKDVASNLGYERADNAIRLHVDEDDKLMHQISASGQNRRMLIINESGLYSLILSSKLPSAKAFKRWVTSDVLPSIRRHGAYIKDDLLEAMAENAELTREVIKQMMAERGKNKNLQAKNEALLDYVAEVAPKARYYDVILQCADAIQLSIIAKDYAKSAVAFNKLLHELGVQFKMGNTWLLYKEHADKGYTVTRTYHVNERTSAIHTYWTQRGRFFLYDLLKCYGILPEVEKAGGGAAH